jgi:hypothetical protein
LQVQSRDGEQQLDLITVEDDSGYAKSASRSRETMLIDNLESPERKTTYPSSPHLKQGRAFAGLGQSFLEWLMKI